MFRDFDMFAPMAALGVVAVMSCLAGAFSVQSRWHWLLVSLVFVAAVPTLELVIAQSDLPTGLKRVRAFVSEEPRRSDEVRGRTWGFLAMRYWQLGDPNGGAIAADSAAKTVPSKTILTLLAAANQARGDLAGAMSAYHPALEHDSLDWRNWIGLGEVSLASGDTMRARQALNHAIEINPRSEYARVLLQRIPNN